MGRQTNIVNVDDDSYLEESVETSLSRRKMPNYESSYTISMENDFVREKVMVLIILIRWSMSIAW